MCQFGTVQRTYFLAKHRRNIQCLLDSKGRFTALRLTNPACFRILFIVWWEGLGGIVAPVWLFLSQQNQLSFEAKVTMKEG